MQLLRKGIFSIKAEGKILTRTVQRVYGIPFSLG